MCAPVTRKMTSGDFNGSYAHLSANRGRRMNIKECHTVVIFVYLVAWGHTAADVTEDARNGHFHGTFLSHQIELTSFAREETRH